MGHAVSKVGDFFSHAANDVAHVATHAADFVAHRAENVYHAADDVVHGKFHQAGEEAADFGKSVAKQAQYGLEDTAKVANAADTVIATVGKGIAHVIKYVPVIGGTIAKGVLGAVTVAGMQNDAIQGGLHAAEHPLDAIHSAIHTVESPEAMLKLAKTGMHSAQEYAGAVAAEANAAKIAFPEFAPELNAISAVGTLVAHPSLKGALQAGLRFVPKGGKLETVVKFANRAYNVEQKASKWANKGIKVLSRLQKAQNQTNESSSDEENDPEPPQNAPPTNYNPQPPPTMSREAAHEAMMEQLQKDRAQQAAEAAGCFSENWPYDVTSPIRLYANAARVENAIRHAHPDDKVMYHFFRQGNWLGSSYVDQRGDVIETFGMHHNDGETEAGGKFGLLDAQPKFHRLSLGRTDIETAPPEQHMLSLFSMLDQRCMECPQFADDEYGRACEHLFDACKDTILENQQEMPEQVVQQIVRVMETIWNYGHAMLQTPPTSGRLERQEMITSIDALLKTGYHDACMQDIYEVLNNSAELTKPEKKPTKEARIVNKKPRKRCRFVDDEADEDDAAGVFGEFFSEGEPPTQPHKLPRKRRQREEDAEPEGFHNWVWEQAHELNRRGVVLTPFLQQYLDQPQASGLFGTEAGAEDGVPITQYNAPNPNDDEPRTQAHDPEEELDRQQNIRQVEWNRLSELQQDEVTNVMRHARRAQEYDNSNQMQIHNANLLHALIRLTLGIPLDADQQHAVNEQRAIRDRYLSIPGNADDSSVDDDPTGEDPDDEGNIVYLVTARNLEDEDAGAQQYLADHDARVRLARETLHNGDPLTPTLANALLLEANVVREENRRRQLGWL